MFYIEGWYKEEKRKGLKWVNCDNHEFDDLMNYWYWQGRLFFLECFYENQNESGLQSSGL